MLAGNTSGIAALLIARVCQPFDNIELTYTSFTGRRCGYTGGAMITAKLIIGRTANTPKAIMPNCKLQYDGSCDRILLFDYSTCGFTEYPPTGLLPDCDFHRQPVALQTDPLVTKCTPSGVTTIMMLVEHHRSEYGRDHAINRNRSHNCATGRRNDYIKCGTNNPLGRALWACLRAKINAIWQLFDSMRDLRAVVYTWFLRTKW